MKKKEIYKGAKKALEKAEKLWGKKPKVIKGGKKGEGGNKDRIKVTGKGKTKRILRYPEKPKREQSSQERRELFELKRELLSVIEKQRRSSKKPTKPKNGKKPKPPSGSKKRKK